MSTAIRARRQTDEPRMIIPFRQHGSAFDSRTFQDADCESRPPQRETSRLTLVDFYHDHIADMRRENLAARTIDSDLAAVSAWKQYSDNIDLMSLRWDNKSQKVESLRILRSQLQLFCRNQINRGGISKVSINTQLRHLRLIFRIMADPIEHGLIDAVPDLGRAFTGTKSNWQLKADRLPPRDTISSEEMTRLFHATEATDDPHLWKVILLILWSYGARTEDTFFRLDWSLVNLTKNVMQFTANKTSKLQGVPLTPLIVRALQSLPSYQARSSVAEVTQQKGQRARQVGKSLSSELKNPIFGLIPKGNWSRREKWKKGYYTTWSRDILPAGRFEVKKGPEEHKVASLAPVDVLPNVMFKHFRKTMVTELNCHSAQAGNWVAAHYMSGVSEVYYDMPTERITTAVFEREAQRLPECFKNYSWERSPHEDSSLRIE